MFNSSSEALSPCLRRFVLRGCLVPNLLELNLWEDGRLSLTAWPLFLSLLLFPLRRTGPHELPDSLLPGNALARVVVTAAFSSLRKAPLPWLMVYFLPGESWEDAFVHLSYNIWLLQQVTFLLILAKPCWVLSWPLIPFTVEKVVLLFIVTSHKIFILFFASLFLSCWCTPFTASKLPLPPWEGYLLCIFL